MVGAFKGNLSAVSRQLLSDEPEGMPFRVVEVTRGSEPDTLSVHVEMTEGAAQWLARAAAVFYPLVSEVDERERQAEFRLARARDREEKIELRERLSRWAFHALRKAKNENDRQETLARLAREHGMHPDGVDLLARRYGKKFRPLVREYRNRKIARLYEAGKGDQEIAVIFGLHRNTVSRVIGEYRKAKHGGENE